MNEIDFSRIFRYNIGDMVVYRGGIYRILDRLTVDYDVKYLIDTYGDPTYVNENELRIA